MVLSIYEKKTKINTFHLLNNLKKEANILLSINQNICNFVNNVVLFLNKKIHQSLIKNIEQDIAIVAVTEEQDVSNSNIQRDLKEEFLRKVLYYSRNETSYADFIEKFLDNSKFSNVLTKKVDNQDLSEIETILLNSIMKHLELLSSFESFGHNFYRFLADPLNEQYYPERENFKTDEKYLKCVQEYEKENAKQSERFEARFQEYEALIAESLANIGQQLREPDEAMQDMKLAS